MGKVNTEGGALDERTALMTALCYEADLATGRSRNRFDRREEARICVVSENSDPPSSCPCHQGSLESFALGTDFGKARAKHDDVRYAKPTTLFNYVRHTRWCDVNDGEGCCLRNL